MTLREVRPVIGTPDGPMDAFLASPSTNVSGPCAILYMDVFGLREELFDLARAFAAEAMMAVVPDLFHRLPVSCFPPANDRDDKPSAEAARANDLTTTAMSRSDTSALIAWLDGGGASLRPTHYFAIGYCMGGRHALAAASAWPERVSGGMSVHGGRLVTDDPRSPHHMIADLRVPFHFACAKDDPTCPPGHCDVLRKAADKATANVTLEVLEAHHGWSFPGRWSYDPTAAAHIHRQACDMITGAPERGTGDHRNTSQVEDDA